MKKRIFLGVLSVLFVSISAFSQALPTGNPSDFKVKSALHSISYYGGWGQDFLTVDEFLVKAKELGFDGVILVTKSPHVSPLDYDKAARARLKKRIEDLGLTLVALAGYNDFTAGMEYNPGKADQAEIQGAYIGMLAELANDLGTKMIRIFTGNIREGVDYNSQYATIVKGIKIAAKEAQKYGVTLFVQNHHNIAMNYNEMYYLLNEAINLPNVKSGWDPKGGYSPEETRQAILKMKPFIVNTITSGRGFLPSTVDAVMYKYPRGEGSYPTDYKTFYNTLKEIGYQGYLVYEMCGKIEGGGSLENLDASCKQFLECIKQFK